VCTVPADMTRHWRLTILWLVIAEIGLFLVLAPR
jgi:hypothetical protein